MQTTIEKESDQRIFDAETRLYDDVTTWAAEVLEGSMRTRFDYHTDGTELFGRDGGALGPVFEDAITDAERLVQDEPYLSFELRRRKIEKEEYKEMLSIVSGERPNTMIVVSDFPPELMHSSTDIGGYNVKRKQTMLRVIWKKPDGGIAMQSQSLDGSNRAALEDIFEALGFEPHEGELLGQRMFVDLPDAESQELLIDRLTGVYDTSLGRQLGGDWYAGRTPAQRMNTYDFVRNQSDLIQAAINQQKDSPYESEKVLYNLAAALDSRYKGLSRHMNRSAVLGSQPAPIHGMYNLAAQELTDAGAQAKILGKSFSGCGVTLGGANDSTGQLSEAGYGNLAGEDKYGPLNFDCPKGHPNTRPRNTLIPRCKTCGVSVKC